MTGRLNINFAMAEGAVLRMLGLVERRGFEVRGISMTGSEGRGQLLLEVHPRDAERRLEVLTRQLCRLRDVRHVSFSHQDDPQ
jgi:acetolactate synthase-1/3 small subunit/acetolactate synthase II small subunit